jgi:hypothetical protein
MSEVPLSTFDDSAGLSPLDHLSSPDIRPGDVPDHDAHSSCVVLPVPTL